MSVSRRPDVALQLNGQRENKRWRASIWRPDSNDRPISGSGETRTEALTALAEALEKRNAG